MPSQNRKKRMTKTLKPSQKPTKKSMKGLMAREFFLITLLALSVSTLVFMSYSGLVKMSTPGVSNKEVINSQGTQNYQAHVIDILDAFQQQRVALVDSQGRNSYQEKITLVEKLRADLLALTVPAEFQKVHLGLVLYANKLAEADSLMLTSYDYAHGSDTVVVDAAQATTYHDLSQEKYADALIALDTLSQEFTWLHKYVIAL